MIDPDLIQEAEASGEIRILRRLDLTKMPHAREAEADLANSAALILDLETTGTDAERHSIIQLAGRIAWYDANGHILALDDMMQWYEDPGEPLTPEVRRLTGLTDADLAGKRIDEGAVASLVRHVDCVIAHNAAFDRKFFELRFPELKGLAWACSCKEIAWPAHDFDGRALGSLLMQCGWFSARAHRADADVNALIGLLTNRFADTGQTALAELLDVAQRTTWRLSAEGANYDFKNDLKDRGYRWNQKRYVWQREVEESQLEAEKAWLGSAIYAPRKHAASGGPRIEKLGWRERHG